MVEIMKTETFYRKCELTASNYGNLANGLIRRKVAFQILLPYYSVIGILNSLFSKYFINTSPYKLNLLSFWGIFISITFLVVSMQISLARYPERIDIATKHLNTLKGLMGKAPYASDFSTILKQYEEIVNNGIVISKRYFYKSCKTADRNERVKQKKKFYQKLDDSEIKKHFSWFERIAITLCNILIIFAFALIYILPIAIYVIVLIVLPKDSNIVL